MTVEIRSFRAYYSVLKQMEFIWFSSVRVSLRYDRLYDTRLIIRACFSLITSSLTLAAPVVRRFPMWSYSSNITAF